MRDLFAVEDLPLEQSLGDALQRVQVIVDDLLGAVVTSGNDLLNLLVDADGSGFAVIAVLVDFTPTSKT